MAFTDYTLEFEIASTNFSRVWAATTPRGETVVVKWAANGATKARRFQREIDALNAAAGPHTMPVLDFDDVDYGWYVMPMAARTLADVNVPADLDTAIEVVEALTASLGPMHRLGHVHRDLKPENILELECGGHSKWVVADFGIIRNARNATTTELTQAGGFLGTDRWAAPEQRHDAHSTTPAADVYATGAIVSWLLTAVVPDYLNPDLPRPPAIRAVVRRALSHSPSHRYSTLGDLLDALRRADEPVSTSLEQLVNERAFGELDAHIAAHPNDLGRIARTLSKIPLKSIADWFSADPRGLIESVGTVADRFLGDRGGLTYSEIDRYLVWSLGVLRWLVSHRLFDPAESLATTIFGVVGDMGQHRPARAIVNWVASLGVDSQVPIEAALHASGQLSFFEADALDRWPKGTDNELVRRLRGTA